MQKPLNFEYYNRINGYLSVFSDLYYSNAFDYETKIQLVKDLIKILNAVPNASTDTSLSDLCFSMQKIVMAYVEKPVCRTWQDWDNYLKRETDKKIFNGGSQ